MFLFKRAPSRLISIKRFLRGTSAGENGAVFQASYLHATTSPNGMIYNWRNMSSSLI